MIYDQQKKESSIYFGPSIPKIIGYSIIVFTVSFSCAYLLSLWVSTSNIAINYVAAMIFSVWATYKPIRMLIGIPSIQVFKEDIYLQYFGYIKWNQIAGLSGSNNGFSLTIKNLGSTKAQNFYGTVNILKANDEIIYRIKIPSLFSRKNNKYFSKKFTDLYNQNHTKNGSFVSQKIANEN